MDNVEEQRLTIFLAVFNIFIVLKKLWSCNAKIKKILQKLIQGTLSIIIVLI